MNTLMDERTDWGSEKRYWGNVEVDWEEQEQQGVQKNRLGRVEQGTQNRVGSVEEQSKECRKTEEEV